MKVSITRLHLQSTFSDSCSLFFQFWAWEHVHINDPMCTLTYVGRPPPLMAYWNEMNVMTWLKYDKKCILETGTVSYNSLQH